MEQICPKNSESFGARPMQKRVQAISENVVKIHGKMNTFRVTMVIVRLYI